MGLLIWVGVFSASMLGGEAAARCVIPDGEDLKSITSSKGLSRVVSTNYLRHSPWYYRWLVKARSPEVAGATDDPSGALLLEELSEAQRRLGDFAGAARTVKSRERLRYKDNLALGGISMAANKFESAADFFQNAFEMNPNGVFLSEGYAMHVLDHIAAQRAAGRKKVPVMTLQERGKAPGGFSDYMKATSTRAGIPWKKRTWKEAVRGVVELILCGHRRSPVVWEMLGDLLREAPRGALKGAPGLAARAYLQASYQSSESLWGRKQYRSLARAQLNPPTKPALRKFERRFATDLKRGMKLMRKIRKDEERWTRRGRNLKLRYQKRYLAGSKRGW